MARYVRVDEFGGPEVLSIGRDERPQARIRASRRKADEQVVGQYAQRAQLVRQLQPRKHLPRRADHARCAELHLIRYPPPNSDLGEDLAEEGVSRGGGGVRRVPKFRAEQLGYPLVGARINRSRSREDKDAA